MLRSKENKGKPEKQQYLVDLSRTLPAQSHSDNFPSPECCGTYEKIVHMITYVSYDICGYMWIDLTFCSITRYYNKKPRAAVSFFLRLFAW